MVVCGIEPFSVALNMPAAIPASSGNNWLGSGRRDWRLSCSVVVGVDIARPSLLYLSGVSVVRRHSALECQAARPAPLRCSSERPGACRPTAPRVPGRCRPGGPDTVRKSRKPLPWGVGSRDFLPTTTGYAIPRLHRSYIAELGYGRIITPGT